MINVYQEKPNIVEVSVKDRTGTAARFIVGKSLDEVIKFIDDGDDQSVHQDIEIVIPKKDRKPRRTGPASARNEPAEPAPERSAGEEDMDRMKKQAAEDKPKESVWP